MTRSFSNVVVLGANGAMGAGSGEVFAAAGIDTVFLARTRDKAAAGKQRAERLAKSEALSRYISIGSYDEDLARVVPDADLVFEAVSEDLAVKRVLFEKVDKLRRKNAIVATVSSGLSIAAMAAIGDGSFRRHFLGVHFFNPPNVIVGCELIPHAGTDAAVVTDVARLLRDRLGRELVRTSDSPAFLGNRVGFKVLNECATLAYEHGAGYVDALLGPHTGRAMAPLATVDFVGWDVHAAIVDNVYANTRDEAHEAFRLPSQMREAIGRGVLGDKTPAAGGFFKKDAPRDVALPEVARRMKALHHVGRYRQAFEVFAEATGKDAELMRRVILGYVSYALARVGEVVGEVADVDRIMGHGFHWAPPGALVDLLGARRAVALVEAAGLPAPRVLVDAAERNQRLFRGGDVGRFFHG